MFNFISPFFLIFDARKSQNVLSVWRASLLLLIAVCSALLLTACAASNLTASNENPKAKNTDSSFTNSVSNMNQTASTRPQIIAFGDSLTAGYGLSQAESYPSLLQQKLDADGYDYEVVNAGVSGETTAQGVRRLEWALGDKPNARIMILELGANDLLRNQPIDQMQANLAQIIEYAQRRNIKVLLAGMLPPSNFGGARQRLAANAFQDLVNKYQVKIIPFFLENVAGRANLNQPDGVHPNASGTRIVADNVYKALKPMLDAESKPLTHAANS